ncbi:MAG: helix-turn-helix domain-containing protein [Deltaproteobacteria bacterium]|nr:helix-turn-helix domain-containing protein [Deltaproteobacteria bacterium]MBW2444477.1 helix-turn-helix domain-containing protein [Deltaproteobacteria bacterium]
MTTPTDDVPHGVRIGLSALLLAIAVWGVVDLVLDRPETWLSAHVLVESGFVVLSISTILYLWSSWLGAQRSLLRATDRLVANEAERDRWKAKATQLLRGLGVEIDAQFERWLLSPAERQVALLLLKGLGHKEAAQVLDRSERTVRQHAVAVYRKSGLAGRAELSAFFLEDLLLPIHREETDDDEPKAIGVG